jgi:hypothetical protein
MSLDLNYSYSQAQKQIQANKTYLQAKKDIDKLKKNAGNAFELRKSSVSTQLNQAKTKTKSYERQIKTQFDHLLDFCSITNGQGNTSISYIKTLMVKILTIIEPEIAKILLEESLTAVGCSQQQTFTQQSIWIRVESIDLGGLLKVNPTSKDGKILYEKNGIQIGVRPFSMNKELYHRIQSLGQSFNTEYSVYYVGGSGQNLFNIEYTTTGQFGETGNFFKINLFNRLNNINRVGDFLKDYYSTIKVVDKTTIFANIMQSLTGMISISGNIGLAKTTDVSKLSLIIQRILGLCFDKRNEIDISGTAKIAELDGIDDSFFEFTDIDLRFINQTIENIKNGVIEFEDCDNVKLPVNYDTIIDSVNQLNFVEGEDFITMADNLTNVVTNNPNWGSYALDVNLNINLNTNFLKKMVEGLVFSLLSPKVLLPIFIMTKSLGQNIDDLIKSYVDFLLKFKSFVINLVSKLGAIFIKELFNIITKDIKVLLQGIISDVLKERNDKRVVIILKLVQIVTTIAELIKDYRQCKPVIDDIIRLLKQASTGWNATNIPLPLLFTSEYLEGYSATRAFIEVIQELQSLGIPTGPMPDGSPNIAIAAMYAQIKGNSTELFANGKTQIAIPALTITPAGFTIPQSAFGKSF